MIIKIPDISIAEAREAFLECPENYFFRYGGNIYDWSPDPYGVSQHFLSDIYVSYGDFTIGWVQSIEVIGTTAIIGHIALDQMLTRYRLGNALAHALGRKFNAHYGVNTIRFDERSIDGKETAYRKFFERLGAIKVPDRNFVWDWHFNPDDIALG